MWINWGIIIRDINIGDGVFFILFSKVGVRDFFINGERVCLEC